MVTKASAIILATILLRVSSISSIKMKLSTIKPSLLVLFTLYGHQLCRQSMIAAQKVSIDKQLNIIAATTFGGKSHAIPMLEICRELVARGHQITFLSNDKDNEWAADQPDIKQITMGAGFNERSDVRDRTKQLLAGLKYIDLDVLANNLYKMVYANHKEELEVYYRLFTDEHGTAIVDIAICDTLAVACIDAAHKLGIPFAVITLGVDYDGFSRTWYLPYRAGTVPASMEHATLYERVYNTLYAPIRTMLKTWNGLNDQARLLKQANIKHYTGLTAKYNQALVIVYTFPGFEVFNKEHVIRSLLPSSNLLCIDQLPRPLPPNVFYAGPLLKEQYADMTPDIEQFLEARSNVIYVGFGGLTPLTNAHFELLVRSFLAAYRAQLIDGVVWGLMLTNTNELPTVIEESLPSSLSSNHDYTVHLVADMLNGKHPFIRMVKRAPQRATLEHPSVKAFISHCGLTSIHETMLAGKPALCIPAFGDQPMNAYRLEYHGAGERLFWWEASTEMIVEKLTRIMQGDTASSARLAMERLGKMARLASRRVPMAADMIELAAIPGALSILEPAEYRLSWWRMYNIDIWIPLIACLFGVIYALYYGLKRRNHFNWSSFLPNTKYIPEKKES
ncbi:hypothetical protein BDF22DRAFT_742345 [Syncephalis plumigaleata]|nr:hypothetical protein BDF22DRAFT_742345 [Syncephalis plumigaleata]